MAYEIIHPNPIVLEKKPLDANDVMGYLEDLGWKPYAVSVDNVKGSVKVFFSKELDSEERKKLEEHVLEYFKRR
jgi:hypothetical protein